MQDRMLALFGFMNERMQVGLPPQLSHSAQWIGPHCSDRRHIAAAVRRGGGRAHGGQAARPAGREQCRDSGAPEGRERAVHIILRPYDHVG